MREMKRRFRRERHVGSAKNAERMLPSNERFRVLRVPNIVTAQASTITKCAFRNIAPGKYPSNISNCNSTAQYYVP